MWRLWAIAEGLTKTISALFQKLVGVVMGTLEMGCIAATIIGTLQMISGLVGWLVTSGKPESLVPDVRTVLTAAGIGLIAGVFGIALSIYTFTLGADLGIRTLLMNFSIVPAALIAAIIWPETDSLGVRQVSGIGVFVIAMWAMLGFPDLALLQRFDAWVWLTLLLACTSALGEIFSRTMAFRASVWANNFWVGVFTIVWTLVGLITLGIVRDGIMLNLTTTFLVGSLMIGCLVVAMVSFKILAYQGGGTIALKKIIMPGTYLVSALCAGVWIYGEEPTTGKLVGVLLWFVSMYLVDAKAANDLKKVFMRA